jgi:hypothetical protein
MSNIHVNNLEQEMLWLKECIQKRLDIYSGNSYDDTLPTPRQLSSEDSFYADFVNNHSLSPEERVVLALAMANHIWPSLLNILQSGDRTPAEFGLIVSQKGNSLIPTANTAIYIIAGDDSQKRLRCETFFDTDHLFYKQSVLSLGEAEEGDSPFNAVLTLNASFVDLFKRNKHTRPRFSSDFPARLITTALEWDDMLLMPHTAARLEETKAFLQHQQVLRTELELDKHVRPGCRILFHGDSGTGKTLAATLLGKHLNKDVYRVDLSAVSSKYIGETSKRLDSLFNTAESKGWIIFIDEGDALLGQRTSNTAESANAHYANQDTAFLLQRIESYDGIIIVATNFKNNIDQAFTRRFQGMVRFQAPDSEMQHKLWITNLPKKLPLAPGIDLLKTITQFPLSPASIIGVITRLCVLTLQKGAAQIAQDDLMMCLKDEQIKNAGRNPMGM